MYYIPNIIIIYIFTNILNYYNLYFLQQIINTIQKYIINLSAQQCIKQLFLMFQFGLFTLVLLIMILPTHSSVQKLIQTQLFNKVWKLCGINYHHHLRSVVILHEIDRFFFLIICPILIIIEILFLIVFFKHKDSLFKRQGTIFFAIIIIQTLINLYQFTHSMYATLNPYTSPMPSSFPGFCLSMAVLNEFCRTALSLYLLYYIIYTLLNIKASIKTNSVIKRRYIHSSVILWCIGWCTYLYFEDRLGLNQFGLCGDTSFRSNQISLFYPAASCITTAAYLLLAFYTYFYFKRHMPVHEGLVKRIYYENQIISLFVIVESILIGIFDTSINIVYFNCFSSNPVPELLIFATIMNITRLFQAVFIFYLIKTNPSIKRKLKKFLRSIFMICKKKPVLKSFSSNSSNNSTLSETDEQELDSTIRQRILELKDDEHQIDLFLVAQILTIIAAIAIAHKQYFRKDTFNNKGVKRIHFDEKITFQIESNCLHEYEISIRSLPKAAVLKGTITMIAPRIFNKLLDSDGLHFIEQSFDLPKNYLKMYNIASGKGGKSGQFFFFSYDNKYVLKTVTNDEYKFILENIEEFYDYYEKNPNSLLAKIYGLYTIKGQDIGRQYNLILMKNIAGCKKSQIIRTYDLKGSKYDREVIKNKEMDNQLKKTTLKDMDFLNLESKIRIKPEIVRDLRDTIKKDTIFLRNLNLIDYSLFVVRVNWPVQPEKQDFWNNFQRIKSSCIENQYYHIGIIDYVQSWNIAKKGQNCIKRFLRKKQISAQEPNYYQTRFMEFVNDITHTQDYSIYSMQLNRKQSIQFEDLRISKQPIISININNTISENKVEQKSQNSQQNISQEISSINCDDQNNQNPQLYSKKERKLSKVSLQDQFYDKVGRSPK